MKFTAAVVLAAAAGASAWASNETYVTETVDVYTTYCPGPTEITHGTKTWTVTEPTTLTITDCPCTITKPVLTTSSVYCPPTDVPAAPPAGNGTWTSVIPQPTGGAPGGAPGGVPGGVPPSGAPGAPGTTPPAVPGSAGKVVLSGGAIAGVVGLAAFIL